MTKLPTQTKIQSKQQSNSHNSSPELIALRMSKREIFSGPLPHPDTLEKYEKTCPGAANRIIKMAESQTNHRQKLEFKFMDSNVKNERLGMNYSFIIVGGFMLMGGILILMDKQAAGYLSLFGPAILQVGNLGYQKYREQQTPKKTNEDIENEKKKISAKR